MLLHQFIVVMAAMAKRFESVLLDLPGAIRQGSSRKQADVAELDLEEVETERAA
jgi:hypothetical protein